MGDTIVPPRLCNRNRLLRRASVIEFTWRHYFTVLVWQLSCAYAVFYFVFTSSGLGRTTPFQYSRSTAEFLRGGNKTNGHVSEETGIGLCKFYRLKIPSRTTDTVLAAAAAAAQLARGERTALQECQ
jgi:hypothetical protein